MDIPRPGSAHRRRVRVIALVSSSLLAVALITLGVARLRPAPPSMERAAVWIDTVKRGELLLQVRGVGTLVPELVRWVPAVTEGRVERVLVQPGAQVRVNTVLLELGNPELNVAVEEAESQAKVARAELRELRVRLDGERLDQRAVLARAESKANQARFKADAESQLARDGLVAAIDLTIATDSAREEAELLRIERERQASMAEAIDAQLAAKQLLVEQREAAARLKRSQLKALRVRAGLDGVLQLVAVEVGQRVPAGANLARVAGPTRLKAVIRVPEMLAKDLQVGQKALIDTNNEELAGRVARIDPAAKEGSVGVDVVLDGRPPPGARADLTVDGTIQLERLANVVYVGRPASCQGDTWTSLFALQADGRTAVRRSVHVGRASVSQVEILEGLAPGDRVILSDTSA
jgi:HlyD family secretion protein